jgi:pimeloyl-ACP methyl ester carboxylesterase
VPSQRRVSAGHHDLPVLEAGAGGRPLLLLHGFTGAGADFTDHLDALGAAGWHAVAPNQRGHLAAPALDGEASYSLSVYADDALAVVDALGWDRFVLLGHSMGGMVAQVLALRTAGRLDGLVLMDTCHGPVDVDPVTAMGAVELVQAHGVDAFADLMAAQAGTSPLETPAARRVRETRPDVVERGDRQLRGVAPAMYAAMVKVMLGQDDRLDDLAGLGVPTLVIVGEEDQPFLAPSRRMAEAIPRARLEVVPDAGHSPQFEAPEAWAKALRSFLDSLPAVEPR